MRAAGVTLDRSAYWLLRVVGECGRVRLSEVALHDGLDISTVSRQVRELQHAGLVRREGDPSDLRAVLVSLTEDGQHTLARLQQVRLDLFDAILASWPAEDKREFARLLERFAGDYFEQLGGRA